MGDDQSVTVHSVEQLRREAELILSTDTVDDHDAVLALGNALIGPDPLLAARLFAHVAQSVHAGGAGVGGEPERSETPRHD